jgi:hypothetical protein
VEAAESGWVDAHLSVGAVLSVFVWCLPMVEAPLKRRVILYMTKTTSAASTAAYMGLGCRARDGDTHTCQPASAPRRMDKGRLSTHHARGHVHAGGGDHAGRLEAVGVVEAHGRLGHQLHGGLHRVGLARGAQVTSEGGL